MKIVDETEKKKRQQQQKTTTINNERKELEGAEAIVKGSELNDFVVH